MNVKERLFASETFLPKEAAPVKSLGKIRDLAVDAENINLYSNAEIARNAFDKAKGNTTGSFTADGILWLAKRFKNLREPIESGVGKMTTGLSNLDRRTGAYAAGTNPKSFRYKSFSKDKDVIIGSAKNADGTTSDIHRKVRETSLFAPVEKTTKFVAPFLATAYVADKLYPEDENLGKDINQTTYGNVIEKSSSIFNEKWADEMDKVASMQKIAELEEMIDKYEANLVSESMEKKAALQRLEKLTIEKEQLEKKAAAVQQDFLEKQAEHEELRLRTIAKMRSKVAVDLAEELLEHKLIKQAQYEETVDNLMECDESALKMYESLVKEARTGADCLESLSYFGEYKDNDKLAAPAKELAKSGLSKRGQTIGDAARDLNK